MRKISINLHSETSSLIYRLAVLILLLPKRIGTHRLLSLKPECPSIKMFLIELEFLMEKKKKVQRILKSLSFVLIYW